MKKGERFSVRLLNFDTSSGCATFSPVEVEKEVQYR
jgi:hypothetical protein